MKTLPLLAALLFLHCTVAKPVAEPESGSAKSARVVSASAARVKGSTSTAGASSQDSIAFARGVPHSDAFARAEAQETAGSWELAKREWQKVAADAAGDMSAESKRWIEYRIADCTWRSLAGTNQPDDTERETVFKTLTALQAKIERPELRDEVWARIEESLGDFFWTPERRQDWGSAWPHYQAALDWWAGAKDVEAARARYLGIVWRAAWPRGEFTRGMTWVYVPIEVLENAMSIARTDAERARAQYLFATVARRNGGDFARARRGFEALEAAIGAGKKTPWYDDALFALAQWYEEPGKPDIDEDGQWRNHPDYVKALALYRRYTEEFREGEAPRWRECRQGAERLTRVELNVATPSAFLPGSDMGFTVSWRNAADVQFALYALDFARDVRFDDKKRDVSSGQWLDQFEIAARDALRAWSYATRDDGKHAPGSMELPLSPALPPGAYVLEARAGGKRARDLVLVGRTMLTLKAAGDSALAWVSDALTSEPVAGADIVLWERYQDGGDWRWRSSRGRSGADGTFAVALAKHQSSEELIAFVSSGERQSFALSSGPWQRGTAHDWRLYAVTDRPVYRPEDTVQWKITARTRDDGRYTTPVGAKIGYEITDARGASVKKGVLALNSFGSAWTELALDPSLPLGEYRVNFTDEVAKSSSSIGNAVLFRLEEYKLPEFEVQIGTPEKDGKKPLYHVGDRVEAELVARTYFGAPVAGADVEVIVRQRPFWRRFEEKREFPWFYESNQDWRYGRWNQGNQIATVTAKTDTEGRARVAFDTPFGAQQDFEYVLEARVTDASRREIRAQGTVRVTRQSYTVNTKLEHQIYRPGDSAVVQFEARDANDDPVRAEGTVKLQRRRWIEVWMDPKGVEVRGAALELARAAELGVPLEQRPGWRVKQRGYVAEEIASTVLSTNEKGTASWSVRVPSEGYYTASWGSRDERHQPIASEASFWVASEATRGLDYQSNDVQIVLDRDTVRLGQPTPVMLTTSSSNRWVLLTAEGEHLLSHQVVHVEGTVKLVMLPIGEEHVPNFWLSAMTAVRGEMASDTTELVVPPTPRFLSVELTPDADVHEPGSSGTWSVVTKDFRGEPVSAELSFSLVDESVFALQQDYTADPRAFFHGQRREHWIQTGTSFDQKVLRRFVRSETGGLRDERTALGEARGDDGQLAQDERSANRLLDGTMMARGGRQAGMAKSALAAAPAAEALDFDNASGKKEGDYRGPGDSVPPGGGEEPAVQVRSDFRATAAWKPDLVTGADGRGVLEVKYPDTLTRWKATARAITVDTRAGVANATARTVKPLTARLQAPRFFVVGDECVISALVDNQTDAKIDARAELAVDGLQIAVPAVPSLAVAAHGQVRFDWKVRAALVPAGGRATFTLIVRSGTLSDGMTRNYPVYAHGIESQVARSLRFSGGAGAELAFALDVPAARRKETTRFELQIAPSLAVTMLDALPYLVDYPYGCTEQTMSRFLPAAIVAKTLKDRGLSAEDAMSRVFGGIERESADKTHPKGKRSLDSLAEISRKSLERLADFQHADGGWGWWKEGDSDAWMTAYVVWGTALARDAGLDVDRNRLERGAEFLKKRLVEAEDELELQAWELHAIAAWSKDARESDPVEAAIQNLWAKKDRLNAYGRALYALACQGFGRTDRARTVLDNLVNGVRVDDAPDVSRITPGASTHHDATSKTAHWGADGVAWRWTDSNVETTAFALRALMAIDPKNELVEPVMTWIVQNRRGAQWSNTRDTAMTVLALNDYLSTSGELGRDVEYEVLVNGASIGRAALKASELLTAPGRFTVAAKDVRDGANEVRVRLVSGSGPLYVAARAEFFSVEEPVPARGSQIFAARQYYKLESRPTLLKGPTYDKVALDDGGTVRSGDRIEVVLTIEAKNNLEYLLFEDLKPAGFEAVETQSGTWMSARELKASEVAYRFENGSAGSNSRPTVPPDPDDWKNYTGRQRGVHQELRDRQVAFFVDRLDQGVWELRYTLRAEVPGRFHGLPVLGQAMYVPEVRCNSSETRVTVEERPETDG